MVGLEFGRTYLDDILYIIKEGFDDHLTNLRKVFQRLKNAGLKINLPKCEFSTQGLEYLGYWLTPHGIQPLEKKIEAIKRLSPPTNC